MVLNGAYCLLLYLADCVYKKTLHITITLQIATVKTVKDGFRVLFKHYRGQYQVSSYGNVAFICMVPLHL